MAVKLGEMMLHAGMLTPTQLEEVLRSQAAFGGRLGTNLVEMGLIAEEDLVRLLHEKLGVTCVSAAAFNSIPQQVLALVPRELVMKHRVLPVSVNQKRLTVAMVDPSDFYAIEEVGFVTGLVVVPCVATELSLSLALERYYDIKRDVRYIPVAGGLRSRFLARMQGAEADGVERGAGEGQERCSLAALAGRLVTVTERSEVVPVLLDYLGGHFAGGAFLVVNGGKVTGVKAVAGGQEVSGFSGYTTDLSELPFLQKAVAERRFYLGKFQQGEVERRLLERMGGVEAEAVLFLPLFMEGEVVALLCAQDQGERLSGGIAGVQQVAEKCALAFKMLGLRKKILSG